MSTSRLRAIRDLVYRIEAALDDVDADVSGDDETGEHVRQALWHLYRSCAEVRTVNLEPEATGT